MLAHLIEARGISLGQLAADTGVAELTISQLLHGKRKFSRPLVSTFSRYFRVEPMLLTDE